MLKRSKRNILITFFSVVLIIIGIFGIVVHAKEITTITGLNGNDATVTNSSGEIVNPSEIPENNWTKYEIKYNWSIPDDTTVESGDTATVTLPDGLVVDSDTTGQLIDSNSNVVGTVEFKKGSSVGTIIFNGQLTGKYGKKGTLSVTAIKPSKPSSNTDSSTSGGTTSTWAINKAGWIDQGSLDNNVPTTLYWDIVINPDGESLKNVKVTDQLGVGQEYVEGSASFRIINYRYDGNSEQIGTVDNATVDANGNQLTFNLGDIDSTVEIVYQTTITSINVNAGNIWNNEAQIITDNPNPNWTRTEDTAAINWGTGGTVESYEGQIEISKVDSTDENKFLPGAEFTLEKQDETIIKTGVTTDENGKLTISNLADGEYQLIETKAPDGYELDSTPIQVVISNDNNHIANVIVKDKPIASSSSVMSSSEVSSSSSEPSSSSSEKSPSSSSSTKSSNLTVSSLKLLSSKAESSSEKSSSEISSSSSEPNSSSSEKSSSSSSSMKKLSSLTVSSSKLSSSKAETSSEKSSSEVSSSSSEPSSSSSKKSSSSSSTKSSSLTVSLSKLSSSKVESSLLQTSSEISSSSSELSSSSSEVNLSTISSEQSSIEQSSSSIEASSSIQSLSSLESSNVISISSSEESLPIVSSSSVEESLPVISSSSNLVSSSNEISSASSSESLSTSSFETEELSSNSTSSEFLPSSSIKLGSKGSLSLSSESSTPTWTVSSQSDNYSTPNLVSSSSSMVQPIVNQSSIAMVPESSAMTPVPVISSSSALASSETGSKEISSSLKSTSTSKQVLKASNVEKQKLPQTGETHSTQLMIVGIVLIGIGGLIILKKEQ